MAEDEDFSQAPPFLFGPGFEKKAKERSEALECLRKAAAKPNTHGQASSSSYHGSAPRKRFFRGACSHGRFQGGSGSGNNYCRPHYHNRGSPGPHTALQPRRLKRAADGSGRPNCSNVHKSKLFKKSFSKTYLNSNRGAGVGKERATSASHSSQFPKNGRPSPIHTQLGKDNNRPMGIRPTIGTHPRTIINAHAGWGSQRIPSIPGAGPQARSRDPSSSGEGSSINRSPPNGRGIHLKDVCGPKKEWRCETHNRPEGTEQVHTLETLQDGRNPSGERSTAGGRLDGQDRPQGCLFLHPHRSSPLPILTLSTQSSDLPIQLPPIRTVLCTSNLHKDIQASGSLAETTRLPDDKLYRRQPTHGQHKGGSQADGEACSDPTGASPVHSELRQVSTRTSPVHTVSGIQTGLHEVGDDHTRTQNGEDERQGERPPIPRRDLGKRTGQFHWDSLLDGTGHTTSTSLLQGLAGSQKLSHLSLPRLRHTPGSKHLPKGGAPMVAGPGTSVEWLLNQTSEAGFKNPNRRLTDGLGSLLSAWSLEEAQHHINYLKLLAIFLATQTFAGESSDLTILVQTDNRSAMTYVNKRGGTHSASLTQLAKTVWFWCMERKISLVAEHIPGLMNTVADEESRRQADRWDWKLCPAIFQRINLIWGPLTLDLCITQLERFFSWRLDPLAAGTDAFCQQWVGRTFANLPWILIPWVLSEVRVQQATVILLAPVWKSQVWYPVLLSLLIDHPRLIPAQETNILQVHQAPLPIRGQEVQLAAWPISGDPASQASYQRRLQSFSWPPGDPNHSPPTIHSFSSGSAGVLHGAEIPFMDLWET